MKGGDRQKKAKGGTRQRRAHFIHKAPRQEMPAQEGLTGFDAEDHHISTMLVGGIAESFDVRSDLESEHTLHALVIVFLGCRLEDLGGRHAVKNTQTTGDLPETGFVVASSSSALSSQ